jgi:hypothetical protein
MESREGIEDAMHIGIGRRSDGRHCMGMKLYHKKNAVILKLFRIEHIPFVVMPSF